MQPVRFKPIVALLAATLLAAALAACGGDDSPAGSVTETTTTAGPAEAEPSPTRRRLEDKLRRLLDRGEADELIDVDCVLETLRTSLSNEAVDEAADALAQGEEIPTAAVDAAFAAGQECARR